MSQQPDATSPINPHLFPLILVEYGQASAPARGFRPAEQQRIEIDETEKAQVRFDNANLDVWVSEKGDRDIEGGFHAELHVRFARMTGFSDTEVTFEGVEQVGMTITGRPVKVIFTNHHQGWA